MGHPMKHKMAHHAAWATVAAVLLAGCGATRQSASDAAFEAANDLTSHGQYAEAFDKYLSNQGRATWDSVAWRNATIAASHTGHDSLACLWGFMYPSTGDTAKLEALAQSLERQKRQTERTDLILSNKSVFNHILGRDGVANMEAETYARIGDARIVDVYPTLSDANVKASVFDAYMKKAQEGGATTKELEERCKDILKTAPEQKTALRFLGRTRYEKAEALYADAMNDYNKKKSQAAYAYLMRDLKKYVTPVYRESRGYFEKLHKVSPDDKSVVKYLININDRLSNEAEVKRLRKLL